MATTTTTTATTTNPLVRDCVLGARQFLARVNAHVLSLSYEQWEDVRFSYDIVLGWCVSRFSEPDLSLSVMDEVAFKLMAEANACANREDARLEEERQWLEAEALN